MTREVAGLKRKLANKRLEENCDDDDDLENCKVSLRRILVTDLTLGLNPLKTTGTYS